MFERTMERELKENRYLIESIEEPFVKKYCEEQLNWYTKKAVFYKYSYYILTIITMVCPIISGVIFVLPIDSNNMKVTLEIILGFSAFSAAMLPLFDCRRKWGMYQNEVEMVKAFLICYNLDGDAEKLIKNIEQSKQNTHKNWCHQFQEEENNKNSEKNLKKEKEP